MISIFPEWWTLLQDLIQLCQHFLQCLSPNTSECKSTFGVATDLGRKSREWVFWSCSQDWKSKQSILPWTAPERPAGLLTARGRIVLVAKAGHKEQVRPHRAQSGTAQALVCWQRGAECLKGSYFFLLKKKKNNKANIYYKVWCGLEGKYLIALQNYKCLKAWSKVLQACARWTACETLV